MNDIIRKFEAELLKLTGYQIIRIEQKEYFNQSDILDPDFTVKRGFYLIPDEGGKVNKIIFGFNYYENNSKPFFSVDSIEDLKKYGLNIPEEFEK